MLLDGVLEWMNLPHFCEFMSKPRNGKMSEVTATALSWKKYKAPGALTDEGSDIEGFGPERVLHKKKDLVTMRDLHAKAQMYDTSGGLKKNATQEDIDKLDARMNKGPLWVGAGSKITDEDMLKKLSEARQSSNTSSGSTLNASAFDEHAKEVTTIGKVRELMSDDENDEEEDNGNEKKKGRDNENNSAKRDGAEVEPSKKASSFWFGREEAIDTASKRHTEWHDKIVSAARTEMATTGKLLRKATSDLYQKVSSEANVCRSRSAALRLIMLDEAGVPMAVAASHPGAKSLAEVLAPAAPAASCLVGPTLSPPGTPIPTATTAADGLEPKDSKGAAAALAKENAPAESDGSNDKNAGHGGGEAKKDGGKDKEAKQDDDMGGGRRWC